MRKFIVGVVVGALLFSGVQAFADGVSLVGKKVGSEAELYLEGKRMSDVIVVDGKSFAPVRELSEALGRSVYYKPATEDEKAVVTLSATLFAKEQRIKTIKTTIEQLEKTIDNIPKVIQETTERINQSISNAPHMREFYEDSLAKRIEELEAVLAKAEEELKGLKIELEALESTE